MLLSFVSICREDADLTKRYENTDNENIPKKILWLGQSQRVLKSFPTEAKIIADNQLALVQLGREPNNWKTMSIVGPGAMEIRISQQGQYRVIFVAKFPEAVYVLHVFQKKTQKTSKYDLNRARDAYAQIQEIRKKTTSN